MNVALSLLMLALSLLTQVANTPNLPQSFRGNAVSIANIAIVEANKAIAEQNAATTTPTPVPTISPMTVQDVTPQPTFGAIIQPPMPAPQDLSGITVSTDTDTKNEYAFKVSVLDTNGKHILKAPITISIPTHTFPEWYTMNRETNGQSTTGSADWKTTFGEINLPKGTHDVTFTSGNLTKTITLEVK